MQVLFLVGEAGFEPAKSWTTDLQSAPFGRSGIPPYSFADLMSIAQGGAIVNSFFDIFKGKALFP